ncbi:carbohydrate kinase family protein [Priestia megaterium]|uniref:Carbohydrate kinase family protein n=1 Tax=Priestia megaterium TaxID=1404 RepID=A0A6H1P7D9_PRIMG|nr:carbohydrate kinase family protein [Priestia megaterium]QIZ09307.1 carbohydrate kinase family protein [Priestia megaterium]
MENPVGIIGNYNIDIMIGNVNEAPKWDTEILADRYEQRIAGTAGYMALALYNLNIPSVILSSVGQDDYGNFLVKALIERGLEAKGIERLANHQTCIGFVVVNKDGSRAITTVSGAHDHFDLEMYHKNKHLLKECKEIVICGTYLLPKFSLAEALVVAKEQRALGKKLYFDPSWDPNGWSEYTVSQTFELLKYVDVFMPNETELCHLTGKQNWRDALLFVSQFCGEVVVKLGSKGAAMIKDGKIIIESGKNVRAVDTTGAGDVFDMGYLFAARRGDDPSNRLALGNTLASLLITQSNRTTYPTLQELMNKWENPIKS